VEECVFNIGGTGCFGHELVEDCSAGGGLCAEDAPGGPRCDYPSCPEDACTPGQGECVDEDTARVCEVDASDPLGCGVATERDCRADEVCDQGACRLDCARECEVGARLCTPAGDLLECVAIEESGDQGCSAYQVLERCGDTAGGVCDTTADACTVGECAVGGRECTPEGAPRECVSSPGGTPQWQPLDACTASQECVDGACLCDDECDDEGASSCDPDADRVLECARVDGCLVERVVDSCEGATVCGQGDGGAAACVCPEVDPNVREVDAGCVPDSPRYTCAANGDALWCRQDDGCWVWRVDSRCSSASGGYECRANNEVRVCSELNETNAATCYYTTFRVCLFGETCQEDGMGGAGCM
jgi:hypothetical protein